MRQEKCTPERAHWGIVWITNGMTYKKGREGEVMSGIPRYRMTNNLGESSRNGAWVKYDDHVAGVNAATATALQEEVEAYDHGYCIGYATGYSRGVSGIGKGLGDYCQVDECAGCGE